MKGLFLGLEPSREEVSLFEHRDQVFGSRSSIRCRSSSRALVSEAISASMRASRWEFVSEVDG
jgi:hypothetical protein